MILWLKSEGINRHGVVAVYLERPENVDFTKSFENTQDFPTFLKISGRWIHLHMDGTQTQALSCGQSCFHCCILVGTELKRVQCFRSRHCVEEEPDFPETMGDDQENISAELKVIRWPKKARAAEASRATLDLKAPRHRVFMVRVTNNSHCMSNNTVYYCTLLLLKLFN